MGCRVTDRRPTTPISGWCAPTFVNLKRGPELIGRFSYDEVLDRLTAEVDRLIESEA